MGKINQEGEFELKVYSGEHRPPHVHVFRSGKEEVVIDILPPLTVMRGEYPRGKKGSIEDLIEEYYSEIVDEWNACNPDLSF